MNTFLIIMGTIGSGIVLGSIYFLCGCLSYIAEEDALSQQDSNPNKTTYKV